jgi:hypothetical protein
VIDAVVSHHMNSFASGVAKFNELLAQELGVPRLSLWDPAVPALSDPLLSFKASELSGSEREALRRLLDNFDPDTTVRVFLHDFAEAPIEQLLLKRAAVVYCGNDEILARLAGVDVPLVRAWAPGLVNDLRRFNPAQVSVFSFGMAHKIRADMFARLRDLLERCGHSYAIRISNATHETSSFADSQTVFDEMHELFPSRLYFLGNLSDVAVYNQLLETTFFAAFFRDGVRANNTSIASAMEHGAVVITNLDEHSPPSLVHMDNVIDIERCDELPLGTLTLRRLSVRAMETAREESWERLVATVRDGGADRDSA